MTRRTFLSSIPGAGAMLTSAGGLATVAAACRRRRSTFGEPWDDIFARMPAALVDHVADPAHEVQLLYTRIDRDASQRVVFSSFPLQIAPERWFTSASWVKFPAVLLMAERLTQLGLDHTARITLDAPPATGNWDAAEPLDEPFERTVRRLFTVSENVPFNRLYEYLGQAGMADGLAAHGHANARIIARLGSQDADRNRSVVATTVFDASGVARDRREARTNPDAPSFPFGPVLRGRAWQNDDGTVVPGAHDFSRSNFIPLPSMHAMMTALIFPAAVDPAQIWRTSPALRQVLLRELSRWPRESRDPQYPPPEYFDGYAKFFIVGDRTADAPDHLRLFSKSGQAYGYLQDCAYVIDREAGVEFLLTATIYANADGVFNDDKYEYDEVSIPFLAALGRAVLDHERTRPRIVRPRFDDLPDAWT